MDYSNVLNQLFYNYDSYIGQSIILNNDQLSQIDKIVICLHNGFEDKEIIKKIWENKSLSKNETIYYDLLMVALKKLNQINNQVIYRYELQNPEIYLPQLIKEFENCYKSKINFQNRAFWNFSNFDWENEENFKIELLTSEKSNVYCIYELFSEPKGKGENELVILPKTKFEVITYNSKKVKLREL